MCLRWVQHCINISTQILCVRKIEGHTLSIVHREINHYAGLCGTRQVCLPHMQPDVFPRVGQSGEKAVLIGTEHTEQKCWMLKPINNLHQTSPHSAFIYCALTFNFEALEQTHCCARSIPVWCCLDSANIIVHALEKLDTLFLLGWFCFLLPMLDTWRDTLHSSNITVYTLHLTATFDTRLTLARLSTLQA